MVNQIFSCNNAWCKVLREEVWRNGVTLCTINLSPKEERPFSFTSRQLYPLGYSLLFMWGRGLGVGKRHICARAEIEPRFHGRRARSLVTLTDIPAASRLNLHVRVVPNS